MPDRAAHDILLQKQKKELIMRCAFVFTAALASFLFCSPSFALPADDAGSGTPRLLKVVALSRHGVRSPTQSPATLSAWSSRI